MALGTDHLSPLCTRSFQNPLRIWAGLAEGSAGLGGTQLLDHSCEALTLF